MTIETLPECICVKLRDGNPFHKEGIGCPRPLCSKEEDHLFTLLEERKLIDGKWLAKAMCWYCPERRKI